jgi:hypothetical protein
MTLKRGWGQVTAMASRAPENFILHVRFEDRDDGGLRAFCDKVPNFFLSHSDPDKVRADVEPALQAILSAMYGMPMRVTRLPEVDEAMDHQYVIPAAYQQGSYLGSVEAH